VLKSRVPRALSHALAVGCLVLGAAASARAEEPSAASDAPPGSPALRKARAAWDRGALKTAEPLYREALEKGGLAPDEVLEGYVRLGSIRASLGKREQAIAAFRAASILDESFSVPREAGRKGPALAAQAKRDTAKIGSIELVLVAPKQAAAGKPFTVTATLDSAHVPIVSRIGVLAKDGTTGKQTTLEAKTAEEIEIEIPAEIVLPSASIVIRVDALDAHANRLASAEERVRVPESAGGAAVASNRASRSNSATGAGTIGTTYAPADADVRKGGSFWSTPWPYVIGSIALAGAGAAVYFGTRPPDDVSVGAVGVRTR
jgi:tetratricopeptide (TPR) repeat protein